VQRDATANVTFLPYQPRELLSRSLSAPDVHLVSLQPQLEGLIVPSKFYGALAVGRPVIFIGARDGEVARIIDQHRCGRVVAPGDVDGLTAALRELAEHPDEARAMGARGLDAYRAHFAPHHAFAAWERVLEEAAS
ncbi:MAG TPA: glycosyltransferase, partial [Thermoanaerobaculia bacterium]|nr:glycosyltransferase [Thermoanaerobaculia bacterium]